MEIKDFPRSVFFERSLFAQASDYDNAESEADRIQSTRDHHAFFEELQTLIYPDRFMEVGVGNYGDWSHVKARLPHTGITVFEVSPRASHRAGLDRADTPAALVRQCMTNGAPTLACTAEGTGADQVYTLYHPGEEDDYKIIKPTTRLAKLRVVGVGLANVLQRFDKQDRQAGKPAGAPPAINTLRINSLRSSFEILNAINQRPEMDKLDSIMLRCREDKQSPSLPDYCINLCLLSGFVPMRRCFADSGNFTLSFIHHRWLANTVIYEYLRDHGAACIY